MYRLNEKRVYYDMADGQAVVINFINGAYYEFSYLGSEVLDRIVQGAAPDAVLQAIRETADCPADIDSAFKAFLSQLLEYEILVQTDGCENGGDDPIPQIALDDGFVISVTEHSEVRDIMLADPMHDADADMGWPTMRADF